MRGPGTISCILLLLAATVWAESAEEIVRKADLKMRGESSFVEATMEIVRPEWSRTMSMKGWTKGSEFSLVLVTAPARDRGSSSLKRGNEMWNWIPSIERVIKVAPSMLGQSWMGSDFTNDDLINQSSIVVDYTHELLRVEDFDGVSCWVVASTPKPQAPVVWGKLNLWVSREEYNLRKVEYYDEFDTLINTMSNYDVKLLGGRMIPTRLEMQPADKPKQKTVMTYHAAEFDFSISDSFFSQGQMKELRQ